VWMPYGQAYTNVPTNGATPNMYVYYPSVGWCWMVAPWVWGWGPMPYFGVHGPKRFSWHGNGYGHWYGYKGGAYGPGWNGGGYWRAGQWTGPGRGYPAPYKGSAPPKTVHTAAHGPGTGGAGERH